MLYVGCPVLIKTNDRFNGCKGQITKHSGGNAWRVRLEEEGDHYYFRFEELIPLSPSQNYGEEDD